MPRALAAIVLVAALALLPARRAGACTTFLMQQDGVVAVGKSYDWNDERGLVIINKRGEDKTALRLDPGETPARWRSRFASVTFNQYGRELPNGGLNEAGLVVEVLWLSGSTYPAPDARPAVTELQWIQQALDRFATVAELVAAAPALRVTPVYADVHYLACDATPACAAFEYLGGELVITAGDALVADTLANDTYARSAEYLARHEGFGGSAPIPTSSSSLDRFVRASARALAPQAEPLPDSAFAILDSVSQGSASKWNLVYVPAEQQVYFRTYGEGAVKRLSLARFELDCQTPALTLAIAPGLSGEVSAAFVPYTEAANRALVSATLGRLGVTAEVLEQVVTYPASLRCVTPEKAATAAAGCDCAAAGPALLPGLAALTLVGLRRRRRR